MVTFFGAQGFVISGRGTCTNVHACPDKWEYFLDINVCENSGKRSYAHFGLFVMVSGSHRTQTHFGIRAYILHLFRATHTHKGNADPLVPFKNEKGKRKARSKEK